MILIIPLGGKGERFKNLNYKDPKPLIKVFGKSIIEWLLDNLVLTNINYIIIPYNAELETYRFEEHIKFKYPNINFIFNKLERDTEGAAETLYITLSKLNLADQPILSLDGDNFYTTDIVSKWAGKNSIAVFEDFSNEPIYSYVKLQNNNIIDIVEKQKISNYACTGAYGFSSWITLRNACKYIIDNNIRQKNEYYISNVVKILLEKYNFTILMIEPENYICLGTPLHVRLFYNNYPRICALTGKNKLTQKRICFDLDNTLVSYPKVPNDYTTVEPIESTINLLRYLKKFNNTIIIHTARRMKTHCGNQGKVLADIGRITFDTLEKFNIPYDEIYFGKPEADFYIDDKAVSAFSNLEKELGYYNGNIDTRNFNTLSSLSINIYRKKSSDLSGEIYYYQHIPKELKDIFPIMIDYDINNTWYDMEKINGVPISKLYLSQELTLEQFDHILNTLNRLHNYNTTNIVGNDDINIYENYSKKLIDRYNRYDYSRFENSDSIYIFLLKELNEYEKNNMGKKSIIHGDPVFTNIMINNFGKIKLYDMRGKLGKTNTILGDQLYDWAKIYQSLLGYDEILEGVKINNMYKNKFITHFKNRFVEIYNEEYLKYMEIITYSLLFTLIPLHNNDKCYEYYKLIKV